MFIIQKYGRTAMIWAAFYGHKPVVEVLLKPEARANPYIKDKVTTTVCACVLTVSSPRPLVPSRLCRHQIDASLY